MQIGPSVRVQDRFTKTESMPKPLNRSVNMQTDIYNVQTTKVTVFEQDGVKTTTTEVKESIRFE